MTLKVAFPYLFGIACVKDDFVASHLELSSEATQWNVSFVRPARD